MDYEQKENMQQPKILSLDDDFSLIKRFIDGDEAVFGELVKRHKDKVRNIVYIALSSSNSVDDIAQEVFITILHHFLNSLAREK